MASRAYHKAFLVRFLTYFFILTGFVTILLVAEPVVLAEFNYRKNELLGKKFVLPTQIVTSSGVTEVEPSPAPSTSSLGFGDIGGGEQVIKPVSTEFGIVIPKINANARIIPNINPANESEYSKALQQGVAAAAGSTMPGENGNLFLFSHSTDAPWNIVRYNAIFYLLKELNVGDKITIFYQGRRYEYQVFNKTVVQPGDTSFLTNRYDKPVLTLQTCDPPGTLLNRLIIQAKLISS